MGRSMEECFQSNGFMLPSSTSFRKKVNTNLNYYNGNYILLITLCSLYVCIVKPTLIFSVIGTFIGLYYILKIGGNVYICFGVCNFLFGILIGGLSFLSAILCIIIILVHASFRKASIKSKISSQETEDVDIENQTNQSQ